MVSNRFGTKIFLGIRRMRFLTLFATAFFLLAAGFFCGRHVERNRQLSRRSYAIEFAARTAAELEWCKSTLDALSEAQHQESVVEVQDISL